MFTFADGQSDVEVSIAVVIATAIVCTFAVTALISIIVTGLYCRHRYRDKAEDKNVKTKQNEHHYEEITLDTCTCVNPAYATTTITADTNLTATTVKMDNNPAYASVNI